VLLVMSLISAALAFCGLATLLSTLGKHAYPESAGSQGGPPSRPEVPEGNRSDKEHREPERSVHVGTRAPEAQMRRSRRAGSAVPCVIGIRMGNHHTGRPSSCAACFCNESKLTNLFNGCRP
jgi:hypothetical protein